MVNILKFFSFFRYMLGVDKRALSEFRKESLIKLTPLDDDMKTLILNNKNKNNMSNYYQVLMYNDDVTPIRFVMDLLEAHLFYDTSAAMNKMIQVHKAGCLGIYVSSQGVADQVSCHLLNLPKQHGHPLWCCVQKM